MPPNQLGSTMKRMLRGQDKNNAPRRPDAGSRPFSSGSKPEEHREAGGGGGGKGPRNLITHGDAREVSSDARGIAQRRERDEGSGSSQGPYRREVSAHEMVGALGSKRAQTASDLRGVSASQAASASSSWRSLKTRGGDGDDDTGLDGYNQYGGDVSEGEPLLREEVADYIRVDFRDGTGPAALLPNDVARAFREAEYFALNGNACHNFWSAMADDGGDGGGGVSALLGVGGGRMGDIPGCVNGRCKVAVHVESATTGTFFKVYEGGTGEGGADGWRRGRDGWSREGPNAGSDGGAGGDGDGGPEEDGSHAAKRLGITVRELPLVRLNKGLDAGVLFVQGMLAGMSLVSVYIMSMAPDFETFLAAYEAVSGEFRRAMFLLCTLALMGTEDQLIQARGNRDIWTRLSWKSRIEFRAIRHIGDNQLRLLNNTMYQFPQVCILVYGGCLVSTLVCAVADTAIVNSNGSLSSTWYVEAMAGGDFTEKVVLWYGFNVARFLFAWAGWFLVCRKSWRASLYNELSQMELKAQLEKLAAAEEQISRLNGRHLDSLSNHDLQELAGVLTRALSHVERVVDLRYRGETAGAAMCLTKEGESAR